MKRNSAIGTRNAAAKLLCHVTWPARYTLTHFMGVIKFPLVNSIHDQPLVTTTLRTAPPIDHPMI
jgi:hypothetical protein